MLRIALAAVLVSALTLAALGSASAMGTSQLKGTVGPGFTITLKDKSGKRVTSVKAGKYTFVISDKAAIHNFVVEQLSGGKFEKALTSVPFQGTKTVTLTLKKGSWKYYCKPHEASLHGSFKVT